MSSTKNGKDLRRDPRLEIQVQLRPVEFFGKEGRVQNVSAGGVLILGTKDVKVGTDLTIHFALPSHEWVMAGVKVVWSKERSSQSILKYDIGCRFTDVPPESQKNLAKYLSNYAPKLS